MGVSRQENRSVGQSGGFLPLFILPCEWEPIEHSTWSHTSRSTYPDDDKGAQAPLFSQLGSTKW
jgi:hypothetical protein